MVNIPFLIDLDLMTNIVRQDQRNPTCEVLDWTASPLSTIGTGNAEGLLRISGSGRDASGNVS
jgi:hypothetical protein